MDGIDPCAVLGVPASATAEDIKRAYRARLLATHPDRGGRREDAEAVIVAFQQLQARRPNPFAPRTTASTLYNPVLCANSGLSAPKARRKPQRVSFAAVLAEVQMAQGSQR